MSPRFSRILDDGVLLPSPQPFFSTFGGCRSRPPFPSLRLCPASRAQRADSYSEKGRWPRRVSDSGVDDCRRSGVAPTGAPRKRRTKCSTTIHDIRPRRPLRVWPHVAKPGPTRGQKEGGSTFPFWFSSGHAMDGCFPRFGVQRGNHIGARPFPGRIAVRAVPRPGAMLGSFSGAGFARGSSWRENLAKPPRNLAQSILWSWRNPRASFRGWFAAYFSGRDGWMKNEFDGLRFSPSARSDFPTSSDGRESFRKTSNLGRSPSPSPRSVSGIFSFPFDGRSSNHQSLREQNGPRHTETKSAPICPPWPANQLVGDLGHDGVVLPRHFLISVKSESSSPRPQRFRIEQRGRSGGGGGNVGRVQRRGEI